MIDGCDLFLTPLSKVVVPPPMYSVSINLENSIQEVCFNDFDSSERFLVLSNMKTISFFESINTDHPYEAPKVTGMLRLSSPNHNFGEIRSVHWINEHSILFISSLPDVKTDQLYEIDFNENSITNVYFTNIMENIQKNN